MKSIVIFSHSSLLGGAERSMLDLADFLKGLGYLIWVVLPGQGKLEDELTKRSIKYSIVDYCWWAYAKDVKIEEYVHSINNIIAFLPEFVKINPKCIITNTAVIPWGALTSLFLDVPHIWNIREFVVKDHGLKVGITFPEMSRLIYSMSEKIWFISYAVKKEFEKHIPTDKSTVIYSRINIPPSLIEVVGRSIYRYANSFKLVIASNLVPNKGQDQAIKAARMLIDQGYNVELLIIGNERDGHRGYSATLKRLVGTKYKNRIHFGGFFDNPYGHMAVSDLVIICSKSEAFSRTMVESGILGKTFVASNTGGNLEMGEGSGLFYAYGKYSDLAGKISSLIDDKNYYKKLCNNHKIKVQKMFRRNPIFEKEVAVQVAGIKKVVGHPHALNLIYKILAFDSKGYYRKLESMKYELDVIKSTRTFKLGQMYYKSKKKALSFLGVEI